MRRHFAKHRQRLISLMDAKRKKLAAYKKMVLKQGDKGSSVKVLQEAVGVHNIDGDFGPTTVKYVKDYQVRHDLIADGIAGYNTLKSLDILTQVEEALSTDGENLSNPASADTPHIRATSKILTVQGDGMQYSLVMFTDLLDKDEYVNKTYSKDYLLIHHTSGNANPFANITSWNNDSRGRIATEFLIGGIYLDRIKELYDGLLVKCMPDNAWAYHIGNNGNSNLHPKSVGIEVCNYGYLTKGYWKDRKTKEKIHTSPEKYYTYYGSEVHESQVCDLGYEWRGHRYWHNYTDAQIETLKITMLYCKQHYDINISAGIPEMLKNGMSPADAFDYHEEAFKGAIKGTISHGNIRKDKTDMYPHPKLAAMLKALA